MPSLCLRLLGTPQIECNNKLVRFSSRKSLALIAYLTVTFRTHRRDYLAAMFWPNSSQDAARQSLRGSLHEINKKCNSVIVTPDRETIDLEKGSSTWIDVVQFQKSLKECMTHGHGPDVICSSCVEPLSRALSLYRGNFLEGFTLNDSPDFDSWQLTQTEYFRGEMASGFELLVRYFRGCGDLHGHPVFSAMAGTRDKQRRSVPVSYGTICSNGPA